MSPRLKFKYLLTVLYRLLGLKSLAMKEAFLLMLILASLCCSVNSKSQVYYVAPDHVAPDQGTCHVNGTTLKPCYKLEQLNDILYRKEGSVELLLLPGTHLIQDTLSLTGFSEVVIHPWDDKQVVVIQCDLKAPDPDNPDNPEPSPEPNLVFHSVTDLKISSLNFSSCALQYGYDVGSKTLRSMSFAKCVFEKGKTIIESTDFVLNVTISNCVFKANYEALSILPPRPVVFSFGHNMIADLQIINTLFRDNWSRFCFNNGGGALCTVYAFLKVNNSHFVNNSCHNWKGGAIAMASSSFEVSHTMFSSNYALGGSSLYVDGSNGTIDACHLVNNTAVCGALNTYNTQLYVTNSVFQDNIANDSDSNIVDCQRGSGGAINIEGGVKNVLVSNCTFSNNSADAGGALYVSSYQGSIEIANTSFISNTAEVAGGAIYCFDSKFVYLNKGGYSVNNYAVSLRGSGHGGFAFLSSCSLTVIHDYDMISNIATKGGAIYAESGSFINMLNNTKFVNNHALYDGGALYLANSGIGIPQSPVHTVFSSNIAAGNGGAVYVSDEDCTSATTTPCFLDDPGFPSNHPKLVFTENVASQGPVLYGGVLDRCIRTVHFNESQIDHIKNISQYEHTPEAITSDPVRICLCTGNNKFDCAVRSLTILNKTRGQAMHLMGIAVDQDSNPKEAYIRASYNDTTAELGQGESRRKSSSNCSNLSYHIFTQENSTTLTLQPEGYCSHAIFSAITIHIRVKQCPLGFEEDGDHCVCDNRLASYFSDVVCNIDTESLHSKESLWLRYDEEYLKVHADCPVDYCQPTSDTNTISTEYPDKQCAYNHSGVVCGACQDNYSIGLGGSKCLRCTSDYPLIWLIPVFAVAGVALVALLLICNMTISHGTLNGLIFYANVVSIARLTSLQNCSINPILSVFIAWINLDFGVEACFYSGMDTYQKTWLQFAFPLYIWLLVGAIILACRYSFTAVRVFGRNNIALLATLFLLSYTKFLNTIITALSFGKVFQGSANDTSDQLVPYTVWIYDGNIEYLKGKHVPLFTVSLVFLVFLILPYTLVLIFGQCIRSIPTRRRCVLWFLNSRAFVSIMDAYTAPYNNRHRYWTGLILLIRCVLFLAFASNYSSNALLANMYITTLVLVGILATKTCLTKVYKNSLVNALENFFLLNLVILSGTVYYLRGRNGSDDAICYCTSASVSVSMLIFTGILAYHGYLQLNKTRAFNSTKNAILAKFPIKRYRTLAGEEDGDSMPHASSPVFTETVVELREELLDDQ